MTAPARGKNTRQRQEPYGEKTRRLGGDEPNRCQGEGDFSELVLEPHERCVGGRRRGKRSRKVSRRKRGLSATKQDIEKPGLLGTAPKVEEERLAKFKRKAVGDANQE